MAGSSKRRTNVILSKEEIGRRLQTARKTRGMTQDKLAVLLGTTQSNVSDIERGARKPTIQQLVKLSRALRVPVDDILTNGKARQEDSFIKDRRFLLRLSKIDRLPTRDRQVLLRSIDNFLKGAGVV